MVVKVFILARLGEGERERFVPCGPYQRRASDNPKAYFVPQVLVLVISNLVTHDNLENTYSDRALYIKYHDRVLLRGVM